jgi:hypothetical protein
MKKRHIAAGLIVLSLLAVTFIATATAEVYYNTMIGIRQGKNLTFTIDTSIAKTAGEDGIYNFGLSVKTDTIVMTVFDRKGIAIPIDIDWTDIAVNPDGTSIVIQAIKQDGFPAHASAINVQADLMEPYLGSSIFASGPGWGWGGHY